MSDVTNGIEASASETRSGRVSRRGFIGVCGAVSAVGASGGFASAAFAATGPVQEYTGRYAVDSHRVVEGYFVWSKRDTDRDVVVVVTASGIPDAESRAIALRHAAGGRIAVVPHLAATYQGAALGGRSALMSAMSDDLPRIGKMLRATGKVSVVTA